MNLFTKRTAKRQCFDKKVRWSACHYRQKDLLRKAAKAEWRHSSVVIAVNRETGERKLVSKKKSKELKLVIKLFSEPRHMAQ